MAVGPDHGHAVFAERLEAAGRREHRPRAAASNVVAPATARPPTAGDGEEGAVGLHELGEGRRDDGVRRHRLETRSGRPVDHRRGPVVVMVVDDVDPVVRCAEGVSGEAR